MKKKSISELIHFFVRHPLQNSLQMKFWRWLVSPADAEDKEEAIQEEWMNIIAEPDEATRRSWYEVRRKAGLANPIIKPHWEIKPLLRIASMILIPLFSVLLSWYYINDYTDSCKLVEYIVPMGERGELTLPDGTKVQINSESSIIYPKSFRGDTRTVYLSGEANFDVHKDKKHPFIVKTSLLSVRALGTKFNIQAYSPGTPLARPFSYSFCRCGSSAGLRASTRLPHCRYGTSSRAQISLASATPRTFSRAMRVPGAGS